MSPPEDSVPALLAAITEQSRQIAVLTARVDHLTRRFDDVWLGTDERPGFRERIESRCRDHSSEIQEIDRRLIALEQARTQTGSRAWDVAKISINLGLLAALVALGVRLS